MGPPVQFTPSWLQSVNAADIPFILPDTGGGVIQDLDDQYTVLVRGSSTDGYALFCSELGPTPGQETTTTSHFNIIMLDTLPGNRTALRHSLRRTGQLYATFGMPWGRDNFGFNAARMQQAEVGLIGAIRELNTKGMISDRPHS
jgi:hypothetical protein